MAIDIMGYTDSDRIRAAAGVSDKDVEDAVINARTLELELSSDLYSWLPTHNTLFTTGRTYGASSEEVQIANLIELFATYFCASLLLSSPLATPQQIGDGKNTISRFSGIDITKVRDGLLANARNMQRSILAITDPATTYTPKKQFSISAPAYDPVTG